MSLPLGQTRTPPVGHETEWGSWIGETSICAPPRTRSPVTRGRLSRPAPPHAGVRCPEQHPRPETEQIKYRFKPISYSFVACGPLYSAITAVATAVTSSLRGFCPVSCLTVFCFNRNRLACLYQDTSLTYTIHTFAGRFFTSSRVLSDKTYAFFL